MLSKWNSFVKLILKYAIYYIHSILLHLYRHRLRSTIALNMLHCFIKQLYLDDNSERLVCIGDIYEMIWSHSQFLDIMLSPNETNNQVKGMAWSIHIMKCIMNLSI